MLKLTAIRKLTSVQTRDDLADVSFTADGRMRIRYLDGHGTRTTTPILDILEVDGDELWVKTSNSIYEFHVPTARELEMYVQFEILQKDEVKWVVVEETYSDFAGGVLKHCQPGYFSSSGAAKARADELNRSNAGQHGSIFVVERVYLP